MINLYDYTNYLNEGASHIVYNGEELTDDSLDSRSFIVYNGKLYYSDKPMNHMTLTVLKVVKDVDDDKIINDYNGFIRNSEIVGRLWSDHNIISVWEPPKIMSEIYIKKICNIIKEILKIEHPCEFKFEISSNKLVKLKDIEGKRTSNFNDLRNFHIKQSMGLVRKKYPKHIKLPKGMTTSEYRNMTTKYKYSQ
jgi:hypothetical protein